MLKRQPFALAAGVVLLAVFLIALANLMKLRFERGDVYPAYSSLRTDPLGTKVFFESLDALPGGQARRNYREWRKVEANGHTTIYLLGVSPELFDRESADQLFPLVRSGARIVMSTAPMPKKGSEKEPTPSPTPKADDEDAEALTKEEIAAKNLDAWGFALAARTSSDRSAFTEAAGLPYEISWHSYGFLDQLSSNWNVIYRDDKKPVMIERPLGLGSIVVATDSYLLSNEAMRSERRTDLLAWLNGTGTRVIFDETHLGVHEQDGIATLIEKYRLYGLVGGLALLAALFAWRQSSSLVPPHRESDLASAVAGRDAQAGLVSLLRRSVPPRELAAVCAAEWKQAFARQSDPQLLQKIDAALAESSPRPVACCQALQQIIRDKKR
jgi:hypothetical protein